MRPSDPTPTGLPWTWGELAGSVPAPAPPGLDGRVASRGVHVAAPVDVVWRWVRQLQVAPYSYDLVDNLGRRSPRTLTPGLGEFEPGARVVGIFTVGDVVPGERVVLELASAAGRRVFGPLTMTYAVGALPAGTWLRCDVHLSRTSGALDAARQVAMVWGDLPMMRKQLLTWKSLAEGRG